LLAALLDFLEASLVATFASFELDEVHLFIS
jgi:hypothetical protein